MSTANDVYNVLSQYIGYRSADDPETGSIFGRWYAEMSGVSYYGETGVPWCAMFQSFGFDHAGANAPGLPGAYCPYILQAGRDEGRMIYNEDAQFGDLVLYDWNHDGVADHIGFVEINHPEDRYLQALEGNAGGSVGEFTRSYDYIIGIIRPYYDDEPAPQPEPDPEEPSTSGIAEDGWFGPDTARKLQEVLGTTVDGVISSQPNCNRRYLYCDGGAFDFVDDDSAEGSDVVRALQHAINADNNPAVRTVAEDGFFGPNTVCALEEHEGVTPDSVLSGPSNTIRMLQHDLNNNMV